MISTSEVSVSITTDSERDPTPVVRELRSFADVTIETGKAIVCLVGDGIRTSAGTVADIFSALKAAGGRKPGGGSEPDHAEARGRKLIGGNQPTEGAASRRRPLHTAPEGHRHP